MPLYEFRCRQCGHTRVKADSSAASIPMCPTCDAQSWGRVFSFSTTRMVHDHYNLTLGRGVSGERDFKEGLKQKSDEMSQRLGMSVDYKPVDLNDRQALGVSDEGLKKPTGKMISHG